MQHQRESASDPLPSGTLLTDYLAVLKRDGTNVVTNSKCTAVSGNWVSPYDDVSATSASDIDIVSNPHPSSLISIVLT